MKYKPRILMALLDRWLNIVLKKIFSISKRFFKIIKEN